MVYKEEEVIGWFRDLFSWRKIELLCTFLRMCHPLELRFIGSYVEQLARTDFMALRDAEAKVNEPNDLKRSLSTELDSETLAGRTIIALSLLRSTNRAAAHVIFNALNHLVTLCEDSIDVGVLSVQSDKNREGGNSNKPNLSLYSTTITKELMLSLTLAIHHPAFVFSECLQLQKCLKEIKSKGQHMPSSETGPPPLHLGLNKVPESSKVPSVDSSSLTITETEPTTEEAGVKPSAVCSSDPGVSECRPERVDFDREAPAPVRTLQHSHSAPAPPGFKDRVAWLKQLRLHKYADNLHRYSDEQLYRLSDKELEEAGLTKGAVQRFQKAVNTLRQSSLVNGELSSSGASSPALGQGKGRKANGSGNSLLSAPHQLTIANDNRGNGSLLCRRGVSDDSSPAGSVYSSPQASPPPPAYKHIATLASPITSSRCVMSSDEYDSVVHDKHSVANNNSSAHSSVSAGPVVTRSTPAMYSTVLMTFPAPRANGPGSNSNNGTRYRFGHSKSTPNGHFGHSSSKSQSSSESSLRQQHAGGESVTDTESAISNGSAATEAGTDTQSPLASSSYPLLLLDVKRAESEKEHKPHTDFTCVKVADGLQLVSSGMHSPTSASAAAASSTLSSLTAASCLTETESGAMGNGISFNIVGNTYAPAASGTSPGSECGRVSVSSQRSASVCSLSPDLASVDRPSSSSVGRVGDVVVMPPTASAADVGTHFQGALVLPPVSPLHGVQAGGVPSTPLVATTSIPPPPLPAAAAFHAFIQQQQQQYAGARYPTSAPLPPYRNGGGTIPPGLGGSQGRMLYQQPASFAMHGHYASPPPSLYHLGPGGGSGYFTPGNQMYPPPPTLYNQPLPFYQPANGSEPLLHPAYLSAHILKKPPQGYGHLMSSGMASLVARHPLLVYSQPQQQQQQQYVSAMGQPNAQRLPAVTCYNCGLSDHQGSECTEPDMEASTAASNFHLNYQTKEDAELAG